MNPYFWGGTWFGVSQASQNKELALGFVRYFVSDKEHLRSWSSNTGDLPNSRKLIGEYGSNASKVDAITGQNIYRVFGDNAEGINAKTYTEYDDIIENIYNDCVRSYLAGKIKGKKN
jgi:ABC-type glycerol-3-phosphate transport system substrate-binding protein